MRTLSELIASLQPMDRPVSTGDRPLRPAFIAHPERVKGYVTPDVTNVQLPPQARVILIEAIGAAGKSAAAREIASNRNWPLIDSAKAQVGSYSLSGLLQDSVGLDSTLIREVVTGSAGLVVDALDEAHLRVGTENFLAFLENIVDFADPSSAGTTSIVMLSRPDTGVLIRQLFEDRQCLLGTLSLDFLGREKAAAYVANYLSQVAGDREPSIRTAVHEHPIPYGRLRDIKFAQIAASLLQLPLDEVDLETCWTQQEVRMFLGYAPVLSVLAESIAVPNPHLESESVVRVGDSSSTILLELVERILEREAEKFRLQTRDVFQANLPVNVEWNGNDAYAPTEQVNRLIRIVRGDYAGSNIVLSVPEEIRPDYEEKATQFVADHPFMSEGRPVNVVFADFLEAHLLSDPAREVNHPHVAVSENVGPFFFRFVHALAPSSGETGHQVIPELSINSLIRSAAQAMTDDQEIWVLSQSGDLAGLEIFDSLNGQVYDFEVADPSGVLEFDRHIRFGAVITDEAVRVTSNEGIVHLGPRAILVARELEVDSEVLVIDSAPSESMPSVRLATLDLVAPRIRSIRTFADGALEVFGAAEHPIFRPHGSSGLARSFVDYASYVDLRAIVRFFKRTVHDSEPVLNCQRLDQKIVGSNERRATLLAALLETNVITRSEPMYYLSPDRLADYGVNFTSLTSGAPSSEVFAFIQMLLGNGSD